MSDLIVETAPGGKGESWGLMALGVMGLLPGLGYFVIMSLAMLFGLGAPVGFLVETLLDPAWSTAVFYALVIGGSALSAVLSLCQDDAQPARRRFVRVCGWGAVLLLLANLPLSIFQLHYLVVYSR